MAIRTYSRLNWYSPVRTLSPRSTPSSEAATKIPSLVSDTAHLPFASFPGIPLFIVVLPQKMQEDSRALLGPLRSKVSSHGTGSGGTRRRKRPSSSPYCLRSLVFPVCSQYSSASRMWELVLNRTDGLVIIKFIVLKYYFYFNVTVCILSFSGASGTPVFSRPLFENILRGLSFNLGKSARVSWCNAPKGPSFIIPRNASDFLQLKMGKMLLPLDCVL